MSMRRKLKDLLSEHESLSQRMGSPDLAADQKAFAEATRRYASLTKMVDPIHAFFAHEKALAEIDDVIATGDQTDEFVQLAKDERPAAVDALAKSKDAVEELFVQSDGDADRDCFVEIRPAAGGQESALFAAELYRLYTRYADVRGWTAELMEEQFTELGGIKMVAFSLSGAGVFGRMKYEAGVHRVQRVPDTEASGRVHTSTVTVAVLMEPDDVDVQVNPADLKIDTFRASGAGGQHVNKTESAVRITHVPTGIVVACQEERSQMKNREKCMRMLRAKLHESAQSAATQATADDRRSQVGTGERSEKIRTYNFPQARVTDHRGGITIYRLDELMNGNLDLIVDELLKEERKRIIDWQDDAA
jgi:peptide chain release factor 1